MIHGTDLGSSSSMTKLSCLFACALVGCVASGPEPGTATQSSSSSIQQQFDEQVQPLLEGACAACHGPAQAVPNAIRIDYDAIVHTPALSGGDDPASSQLLTKGAHEGPAWTAEQSQVILDWLEALAAARAPH
jgi:hypothetical protein